MGIFRIIITGAGAPGIKGTIYSLRRNYDKRKFFIIGTDAREEVVGKYFCDKFFVIPEAKKKDQYLNSLFRICKEEYVDVLIPQNTSELLLLAQNKKIFEEKGTRVMVSNEKSIIKANDKFELLKLCNSINVNTPKYKLVSNLNELLDAAKIIGWPEQKVVVKPPISNGQRGVRIVDESKSLKEAFYKEKPSSLFIKMDMLFEILEEHFPPLIVSEYLPGKEYTVDLMRAKDKIIAVPRTRDLIQSGITFNGSIIKHEEIIRQSELIAEKLDLEYCFGFQFKENVSGEPVILECNPRIQGTMVMSTIAGANLIYSSIKYLLGEEIPEIRIDWNTRFLRYWGGVGITTNEIITL